MPLANEPWLDGFAGRPPDRAMIAVFADQAYLPLLAPWLGRLSGLGVAGDVVIFALDAATGAAAAGLGAAHVPLGPVGSLAALWRLRVQVFAALARRGIGFVHADADTVWLADPRPRIAALGADIVFSQGTVWPPDIARAWGFVLCCGFFQARAVPGVEGLFDRVERRLDAEPDDQVALNRALQAMGIVWDPPARVPQWRRLNDCDFALLAAPVTGRAPGLGLAVLPHHEVPRLAEPPPPGALVVHPLSPKRIGDKLALFRRLGLWQEEAATDSQETPR